MTQVSQQPPVTLTRQEQEAQLIFRAWQDDEFKQELLDNPKEIWQQEFPDTSLDGINIQILEETITTLYLVVPWQDQAFKDELLRSPQKTWKREFGTSRLQGRVIRVYEETDRQIYLVMPVNSLEGIPRREHLRLMNQSFQPGNYQSIVDPKSLQASDAKTWQSKLKRRPTLAKILPRNRFGRLLQRVLAFLSFRLGLYRIRTIIMYPFMRFQRWMYWIR